MSVKSKAIYELILIAVSVALITVCAWTSIPFIVSVTMQTLAIFLIAGCFPLKISLSSVILYLLLGFIGIPVFSGFNGGFSAFLGASGGFIIGFIPMTVTVALLKKWYKKRNSFFIFAMLVGLIICYACGCAWYILVFNYPIGTSLISALSVCVFPFAIFDVLKIFLAALIRKKLLPYIQRLSI